MSIIAFNGYPHSVSILRDTGIERIVTYHPTKNPTPNMTYLDEFIVEHCDGVYLKWLNKKSGYDYWLFNREFRENIKTSDLGRVVSTDTNRARALSATHSIGKKATKSVTVTTKATKEQMVMLEYVLISPEVYVFNPASYTSSVNCAEFNKVFVRPGNYVVNTNKNNTQKLKFTFDFDDQNVQTII